MRLRPRTNKLRNLSECVPPIEDVWRETSCLTGEAIWHSMYSYDRRYGLRRTLRHVTTLISLEEVYGAGLLERFLESTWRPEPPHVTR